MQNKPLNEFSAEELALLLQEQYQQINQCQQNIGHINNELQTRLKQQKEESNGAHD